MADVQELNIHLTTTGGVQMHQENTPELRFKTKCHSESLQSNKKRDFYQTNKTMFKFNKMFAEALRIN